MKIIKNEQQGNLAVIEIEVDYSSFEQECKKAVNQASKEINLPGFRPGKAPKSMVEKVLNHDVIEERAAQNLIGDLYPEILKETKINPVDYPSIEIINIKEGNPFSFRLKIEVYPEIKLVSYKGIKVSKKPTEVTEDELIAFLGNIQNRFSKTVEVADRKAQVKDFIDIEIEADSTGQKINRWPKKMQYYEIGSGYIHADFDSQVVGMGTGEQKDFKVTFPADILITEIAGKEVSFKVKLEKISAKELLPLDDEFAKAVSKYGTLAELKEEVKKSLEIEKKEESTADLKNKLIDEASKNIEVEIPKAMVKYETDIMLDELKSSLAQNNLTLDGYLNSIKKSEEELRKELKFPAEARTKGKIVLKKISELENISVTPDDIDQEIRLMAQGLEKDFNEYKSQMGEGGMHYIKDYLLRKKALDFLVENAQIS